MLNQQENAVLPEKYHSPTVGAVSEWGGAPFESSGRPDVGFEGEGNVALAPCLSRRDMTGVRDSTAEHKSTILLLELLLCNN